MKDAKPDAMFVFVPAGQGGNFMKQYAERGLDKSGIKVIGPGDVIDDDLLNGMGDAALGAVTAHLYSAAHPSAKNKDFVAAYKKAYGTRPGFMAVGGYDGIHLIYEALKKTGGKADGDSLIAAMKGMAWESPRGPISIDPETRDIVQNIYIRKVEKNDGELYNIEFATFEAVKDPARRRSDEVAASADSRCALALSTSMPARLDRRAVGVGVRCPRSWRPRVPPGHDGGRAHCPQACCEGLRRRRVRHDPAHHPVRRRRLRHVAVRAGVRAGGDAGADELRQPRPRRLRDGGRLYLRRAGQPDRLAVLRRAADGLLSPAL